jgi:hypothetical protein
MKNNLQRLKRAIVASLSPDLLKPEWLKRPRRNKFTGQCYVASEALYHMLGGPRSGYVPQVIRHEGGTHWYLKQRETARIQDLTAKQFRKPVPYSNGHSCGFLTRRPSKRAAILIARVRAKLAQ